MGASPARPLTGVRIVDFNWVMAGPICTRYLAALSTHPGRPPRFTGR